MDIDQFATKTDVTRITETRRWVEIDPGDIDLVMRQAFAEKWGVRADQVSTNWYCRRGEFDGLAVESVIRNAEEGES